MKMICSFIICLYLLLSASLWPPPWLNECQYEYEFLAAVVVVVDLARFGCSAAAVAATRAAVQASG